MTVRHTIAEVMVENPITLSPGQEINHAVKLLLSEGISGAPVVNDMGEIVGILTKKDCFRAALNATYYKQWGGTVERYMSGSVHALDASTDIVTAAEAFLATSYRIFPVVREGRLVGLISRSDLLGAFVDIA